MSRVRRRFVVIVVLGVVVGVVLGTREALFRAHAPTAAPSDEDHPRPGPAN